MVLIPEKKTWFKIQKSINQYSPYQQTKEKPHGHSIDAAKGFDKTQHAQMIKNLKKLRIRNFSTW